MTRFARAKGSKSSNERLPNEATPWHVMKQQLEVALAKEQEKAPQVKTKSAKQLLDEKDLHYSKSLGNVNTDWAEFENSKNKDIVKNGKVEKKTKDQTKKLKKVVKNAVTEKQVDAVNSTPKNNSIEERKFEVHKTSKSSDSIQNKILKQETADDSNSFKDKKRKSKEKKTSNLPDQQVNTIKDSDIESKTKVNPENSNKLSKRQKRNQKKQNEKESENTSIGIFNIKGNKWNNSVKFGKKIDNNQNSNSDNFVSKFEQKNFRRFGNNVPRKYQRKMAKIRDNKDHKRRKPNTDSMQITINGMNVEIVKYDGFPVKKEDAQRLIELRKEMTLKGIPKSEIDAAMKLERRKCEKALARIRKQVCFHCRKAGHNLSECPELGKEEAGTGICFKCGSTEHTHFECKVTKSDDYRYAKCFICQEQGHIAKQCPDNPKGLYPDGGSCKICGDVTHLKKDCPDLVKEKEETTITLGIIKDENLESLEHENKINKSEIKPSKKIIKF